VTELIKAIAMLCAVNSGHQDPYTIEGIQAKCHEYYAKCFQTATTKAVVGNSGFLPCLENRFQKPKEKK
jgi:hypothetical protein